MNPDEERFRRLFSHFPTGVAVVTGTSDRGPVGMTANAVFGLNMLRADQGTLSRVFASKLPEHEKFEGVAHRLHDDVPIIDGALAWMTCDLVELHPGGDHTIGVGAVREMAPEGHGDPLVWYRGDYRGIV